MVLSESSIFFQNWLPMIYPMCLLISFARLHINSINSTFITNHKLHFIANYTLRSTPKGPNYNYFTWFGFIVHLALPLKILVWIAQICLCVVVVVVVVVCVHVCVCVGGGGGGLLRLSVRRVYQNQNAWRGFACRRREKYALITENPASPCACFVGHFVIIVLFMHMKCIINKQTLLDDKTSDPWPTLTDIF